MSIPTTVPPNPVSEWSDYFESTLDKPLHPLFRELEPYLTPIGRALDLGCGVGHAVLWLASKGWEVEAVDGHPEALEVLTKRIDASLRDRISLKEQMLEAATIPRCSYELIIAAYSLFFLQDREAFARVWRRIRAGLKPGGLFLGEFLGFRDDWANELLTHDRRQVRTLLRGLEVLSFEEAEQDGHTSQGTEKHWHVFHVIARKPVQP